MTAMPVALDVMLPQSGQMDCLDDCLATPVYQSKLLVSSLLDVIRSRQSCTVEWSALFFDGNRISHAMTAHAAEALHAWGYEELSLHTASSNPFGDRKSKVVRLDGDRASFDFLVIVIDLPT